MSDADARNDHDNTAASGDRSESPRAGRPRPSPAAPLIRDAQAPDEDAVIGIREEAIATSTGLWIDQQPSREESSAWARAHRERRSMLVAEDPDAPGAVLGYATFAPLRSYSGYRFTGEVSVFLVDAAQGHGIGRALLEALVERAQEAGMRSLNGLIEAGNTPSIALHSRCGFTEVGRIPQAGLKFGHWWDLVIMQRLL